MARAKKNTKKKTPKKIRAKKPAVKKSAVRKSGSTIKKKSVARKRKIALKPRNKKIIVVPEENINDLVHKGRVRGFVNEQEILMLFPELEEYVSQYEEFLEELDDAGVNVVEASGVFAALKTEDLPATTKRKSKNIKLPKKDFANLELSDISADSIQMYLREIGKVPLLTGD